jgi:plasmid stabilization system protein ParE
LSARVLIVEAAEAQIRRTIAWWQEHRPAAPRLLVEELARALLLLEEAPEAGAVARTRRPGTRRVLLRRSRLWVYYAYDRRHEVVYVLAVWSAQRDGLPPGV